MTDEPIPAPVMPDDSRATLPVIYVTDVARRDLGVYTREELLLIDRALSVFIALDPPLRSAALDVQTKLAGLLHLHRDLQAVRLVRTTVDG